MKQEVYLDNYSSIQKYKASLACQVRTNLRWEEDISYKTLAQIFKREIVYNDKLHRQYMLSFFEECYPSLIKKFMVEQSISRQEVLDIFELLPKFGETSRFSEVINSGEF